MKYKIAVFDLDNTICPLGGPASAETTKMLKEMEERGIRICIASGKPTYYLTGFLRQLGLKKPLMLGENGTCFQEGVDLPPVLFRKCPLSPETKKILSILKQKMADELPELWYQPNEVMLTPFPRNEEEKRILRRIMSETFEDEKLPEDLIGGFHVSHQDKYHLDIYEFGDSFDIVPMGVDKGTGICMMGKIMGVLPEEMIAFGDGANDYPMFEKTGLRIGIRLEHPEKVDYSFNSIEEALKFVKVL